MAEPYVLCDTEEKIRRLNNQLSILNRAVSRSGPNISQISVVRLGFGFHISTAHLNYIITPDNTKFQPDYIPSSVIIPDDMSNFYLSMGKLVERITVKNDQNVFHIGPYELIECSARGIYVYFLDGEPLSVNMVSTWGLSECVHHLYIMDIRRELSDLGVDETEALPS